MPRSITLVLLVLAMPLSGCAAMVVGTVVGVATTVAVETAKVPFKVGDAAIDVMTDDDDDEEAEEEEEND